MTIKTPDHLPSIPAEGDLIAGKYRVDRVLGQGGMGVVYKAIHEQLDQPVAIKFLSPEVLRLKEPLERFLREARAAVKIQSAHVAKVIDVGQLPTGLPYMVMEFLDGRDLADIVEVQGPLPFEEAAEYILQTCDAIAEAHNLGIIHRDLKPSNLFLCVKPGRRPVVKVLDFGISKLEHDTSGKLTTTNIAMGSPHYMSPEHIKNPKSCDARSDIWSLGMVLYELLTGRTAFGAESVPALFVEIATEAPKPILELRPSTPPALAELVMRCLSKDPAARYQSIQELAAALAPLAPERALSERIPLSLMPRASGRVIPTTESTQLAPSEAERASSRPPPGRDPERESTLPLPPQAPGNAPGAVPSNAPSTAPVSTPHEDAIEVPLRPGAPRWPLLAAGIGVAALVAVVLLRDQPPSPPLAAAASASAPPAASPPATPSTSQPPAPQPPPAASSHEPVPAETPPTQRTQPAPAKRPPPSTSPPTGVRSLLDDRRLSSSVLLARPRPELRPSSALRSIRRRHRRRPLP